MRDIPYPHPGEILLEEFLKPMQISQYRLAKEIGVSQQRIGEIITGKRGISMDTGLRLARFFGTSESFWTRLQLDHELATTRDHMADILDSIRPCTEALPS
ncbi:MAG: HigA family addiction module antitoxin [Lautropia sp.]|nr:HigA family addiction module antitoxin [Lautropia sp.]